MRRFPRHVHARRSLAHSSSRASAAAFPLYVARILDRLRGRPSCTATDSCRVVRGNRFHRSRLRPLPPPRTRPRLLQRAIEMPSAPPCVRVLECRFSGSNRLPSPFHPGICCIEAPPGCRRSCIRGSARSTSDPSRCGESNSRERTGRGPGAVHAFRAGPELHLSRCPRWAAAARGRRIPHLRPVTRSTCRPHGANSWIASTVAETNCSPALMDGQTPDALVGKGIAFTNAKSGKPPSVRSEPNEP